MSIPESQAGNARTARHWVIGSSLYDTEERLQELERLYPGEGVAARKVLVDALARWEPAETAGAA